jgi:3-methyladenine DNA glycosylase/8-oxoguanine DNA glycosylase
LKLACAHASRLQRLVTDDPGQLRTRLEGISGIGPWTSAEVARVVLGDADAVSVGDFHLKNLVAYAFTGARKGTDEEMVELLEPYRGHRARVIKLLEASGIRPPAHGPRMAPRSIAAI